MNQQGVMTGVSFRPKRFVGLRSLLLLLGGTVLLLQSGMDVSHPSRPSVWPASGLSSGQTFISASSSPQLPSPFHGVLPIIDIEVEPAGNDDLTRDAFSGFSLQFSEGYAMMEMAYSDGLRTRLLRMGSTSHLHEPIPLYIFQHSWKAYLA